MPTTSPNMPALRAGLVAAASAAAGGGLAAAIGLPAAATALLCGLPATAAAAADGRRRFVAAAAGLGVSTGALVLTELSNVPALAAAVLAGTTAAATFAGVAARRREADATADGLRRLNERLLNEAAAARPAVAAPSNDDVVSLATALLTLQEAGERIAGHVDPDTLVPTIITAARSTLGCRDAAVYFWDRRARTLRDAFPSRPRDVGRFAPEADRGPAAWVLDRRLPLTRDAVEADPALAEAVAGEGRTPAGIAPLMAGHELLGLLVVEETERPGEEFARLLMLTANLAGLALKNAQLFRRIEEMALRDGLTGLLNRTGFEAAAADALAAAAAGRPLAVMLADLDDFKTLNDTHGHAAGDAVLREAARLWRAALPDGASVARIGGEEFVAVLPGCDLTRAADLAECLRESLAAHPFRHDGTPLAVTASFGLAEFGRPDRTLDALLRSADAALYRAKHAGRNRVRTADPATV